MHGGTPSNYAPSPRRFHNSINGPLAGRAGLRTLVRAAGDASPDDEGTQVQKEAPASTANLHFVARQHMLVL
jgi:hypothetical protein